LTRTNGSHPKDQAGLRAGGQRFVSSWEKSFAHNVPGFTCLHQAGIDSIETAMDFIEVFLWQGDMLGVATHLLPELFGQENALGWGKLRNVNGRFHGETVAQSER